MTASWLESSTQSVWRFSDADKYIKAYQYTIRDAIFDYLQFTGTKFTCKQAANRDNNIESPRPHGDQLRRKTKWLFTLTDQAFFSRDCLVNILIVITKTRFCIFNRGMTTWSKTYHNIAAFIDRTSNAWYRVNSNFSFGHSDFLQVVLIINVFPESLSTCPLLQHTTGSYNEYQFSLRATEESLKKLIILEKLPQLSEL